MRLLHPRYSSSTQNYYIVLHCFCQEKPFSSTLLSILMSILFIQLLTCSVLSHILTNNMSKINKPISTLVEYIPFPVLSMFRLYKLIPTLIRKHEIPFPTHARLKKIHLNLSFLYILFFRLHVRTSNRFHNLFSFCFFKIREHVEMTNQIPTWFSKNSQRKKHVEITMPNLNKPYIHDF